MNQHRCGFARIELVTIFAVAVCIVVTAALAMSAPQDDWKQKLRLKEQSQLKQLHQVMLIHAREFDGAFMIPGLINREADRQTGRQLPGRGPEDVSLNHTAPLYAALIAQNYITPELVISPAEINPNVTLKRDYDYNAYSPLDDTYWDESFAVRIDGADGVSNASYAHMAICGDFRTKHWRDNGQANRAVFSTRGPEDGTTEGDAFTRSLTLKLFDPRDAWSGAAIGTVDVWFDRPDPDSLQPNDAEGGERFNLFRMSGGGLSISIASTRNTVQRIWDPLEPAAKAAGPVDLE